MKPISQLTLYSLFGVSRIMKSTTLHPPSATPARGSGRYRGRQSRQRGSTGSDSGLKYPITFTEYGVVEHEELFLVNTRPSKKSRRRPLQSWDTVGTI